MTSTLAAGLSDAEVAKRVAEGKTNDVLTAIVGIGIVTAALIEVIWCEHHRPIRWGAWDFLTR
jgi:hypothetical protein